MTYRAGHRSGHGLNCPCLSCNPSEPGQNALQVDQRPCADAGEHLRSQRHPEDECVTLCGGCARPIREVEEGVWVRTGSEECEAGGVHSPPRPAPPALSEFYLYRNSSGQWWDARLAGEWTGDIRDATIYPRIRAGANGEWVKFVEVPF